MKSTSSASCCGAKHKNKCTVSEVEVKKVKLYPKAVFLLSGPKNPEQLSDYGLVVSDKQWHVWLLGILINKPGNGYFVAL